MNMKKHIVQGVISMLAIIGIFYGRLNSVPDATSKLYGIPLNWGIHQLVIIAGPVDIWSVNITYLAIDLILCLILILALPMIITKWSEDQ